MTPGRGLLRVGGILFALLLVLPWLALAAGRTRHDPLLAFQAWERDNWEIFIADPSYRLAANLTRTLDSDDSAPSWSADGRLAYVCGRSSDAEICVRGLDDLRVTNVSHNPNRLDAAPVWSPDGKLAFLSARDNALPTPYVLDPADGSLVKASSSPGRNIDPVWLSGNEVVFVTNRRGDSFNQIVIFNLRDQTEQVLQDRLLIATNLVASTTLRQMAFTVQNPVRPERGYNIYAWQDGQDEQTMVTGNEGFNFGGSWSPDGRLVYSSTITGNIELFVWDPARQGSINISNHPSNDSDPIWSSDGRVAFVSTRIAGQDSVYLLESDLQTLWPVFSATRINGLAWSS